MPNMANIVVKKADNTTDITYTGLNGAGADGTSAKWREETTQTVLAYRPTLTMSSVDNGPKTARRSRTYFRFPLVRVVNGVEVVDYYSMEVSELLPLRANAADLQQAVAQGHHLIASALIKSASSDGQAPT